MINVAPYLSEEQSNVLINIQKPEKISDKAISLMNISTSEKQEILEEFDINSRLEKALVLINREIQRIELGERIQADVQDEISKTQKEYYLREQMKAIKKELGEDESNLEIKEIPISYYGRTYEEGKKITAFDGLDALFVLIKYRYFN